MELSLKPHDKNTFTRKGILIRGAHARQWLQEIQRMGLSLDQLRVCPLPGRVANSLWGCLVIGEVESTRMDIGRNAWCQVMHNTLFIPERAVVYPALSAAETLRLFAGKPHLMHPEIGLVALEESIDWKAAIQLPAVTDHKVTQPAATPFVPVQVRSFQIRKIVTEDLLQDLEEKVFPRRKDFTDKPLNPFEKAKLFFYRQLFTKQGEGSQTTRKTSLFSKLESLARRFAKNEAGWPENLQRDYEELERRNQKHLDRLMDLFKKDPAEALKYAIPLDGAGAGRGGQMGAFNMQKRWTDFSLFSGKFSSGSGSVVMHDGTYQQLFQQYTRTAQDLVRKQEYTKAAFVYMKLLKNYPMAAETLEKGKLYGEAASVYLTHCNNREKAAECFEKGAMIANAIELHQALNNHEKVGDLYASIHQQKEAFVYYQKVVDGYSANQQYLKAARLLKNKMEDEAGAQETLLKGWRLGHDAFNCLNNYFAGFCDPKQLGNEMQVIYQKEVTPANRETFLRVLQHEYGRHPELSQAVRDMAYEIIVEQVKVNPSVVSELRTFNKKDQLLMKDTLRFKMNEKK